jgi:hypothetical protein
MQLQIARIVTVVVMLIIAFVAGQQFARPVVAQSTVPQSAAAPSQQKWEYRIVGSLHTVDQINKLGEDGWEVVTLNASNRVLLKHAK